MRLLVIFEFSPLFYREHCEIYIKKLFKYENFYEKNNFSSPEITAKKNFYRKCTKNKNILILLTTTGTISFYSNNYFTNPEIIRVNNINDTRVQSRIIKETLIN